MNHVKISYLDSNIDSITFIKCLFLINQGNNFINKISILYFY